MMKEYVIALKELNIEDKEIIRMMEEFREDQFKDIFLNCDSTIIDSDLALIKYREIFSNTKKLKDALERALHILHENKSHGIRTIIYCDKIYPENLKKIDNPPPVIYSKGANFTKKHIKALACIGTRTPSKFSVNATNYLIPQWVNEGFIIVSGLAIGVDTLSHISCLESKGTTVAVLAHGLDNIYPSENKELADRIISSGGTLISEYPVGTKPEKYRFVDRNRIIVGLAAGTVIFEGKIKSGSMHSVDFSIQQNKPVFCPKPSDNISDTQQEGLRYLIKNNKAIVIENGASFEVPIFELGYKLKNSPVRLNKIKEIYIRSLLNNAYIDIDFNSILDSLLNKDETKRASVEVNKDNYEELKRIAADSHLTIKELVNSMIESIIKSKK